VEQPNDEKHSAHDDIVWGRPVGDMKLTAIFKQRSCCRERPQLLLPGQVVEYEARHHAIEGLRSKGRIRRVAVYEIDIVLHLGPRESDDSRIRIKPDQFGFRIRGPNEIEQRPSATSQVEDDLNTLAKPSDEALLDRELTGGETHHRIVEAREGVEPERGYESGRG